MKKTNLILGILIGGFCSVVATIAYSQNTTPVAAQKSPLTRSQIEKLIDNKTPDIVIAGEIRERGIAFKVDGEVLASIGKRGAGERTMQALLDQMTSKKREQKEEPKQEQKTNSSGSTPVTVANTLSTPPPDVIEAVTQALSRIKVEFKCYQSCYADDSNSRAVFFELNQKWQEKAVQGLVAVLAQTVNALPSDDTREWKATKLVEYFLREPQAQALRDDMVKALCKAIDLSNSKQINLVSNFETQKFMVSVIRSAPISNESKYQRLLGLLGTMQDYDARGDLIRALGELAQPAQREGLAAAVTQVLVTTQSRRVAEAAANVIRQFGYRKAIPDLMKVVRFGSGGVSETTAELLRSLIPPNDTQEREKLAALMLELLETTTNGSFANEVAKIIKEFNYRKAAPQLIRMLSTGSNLGVATATDIIKAWQYREALPAMREAVLTAPLDVIHSIANALVSFQDKEAVKALRTRLQNDHYGSSYSIVPLGKALYDLEGESSVPLLIQSFTESEPSLHISWIAFFKEKKISKAREAVLSVRDKTTDSFTKQQADDFLKTIP